MTNKTLKKDPYFKREAKRYANPIPSREFIMGYLKKIGRPATFSHLVKNLELKTPEGEEALRRRLIAMLRDGQLMKNRRDSFALVDQLALVCGRVEGTAEGYGFLIPDDASKDIFLSAEQMRSVFTGDRVLVNPIVHKNQRREGIIVEVLEHATLQVVGRYTEEDNIAFVSSINKKIGQNVVVPLVKDQEIKTGDFVVAKITAYPSRKNPAIGEITKVLGKSLSREWIELAINSYEIPHEWSQDVLHEAGALQRKSKTEISRARKDLTNLPFVTIDGEDAQDFDDAIYCEHATKNGWILYVAIADVSFYVEPNSGLDQEAVKRGNSVYFPSRTVPMLPEVLANDLCSLKPNVPRLCMVCEMHISPIGTITRYDFCEAVIRSQARLTYHQTFAILEGKKGHALASHLLRLRDLYQVLLKQRKARGALEFETIESRIVFGDGFEVKQIVPVTRNYVHRIVEECMLAANVCASKFLLKGKIQALYRVHESPEQEKLETLRRFLKNLGLNLKSNPTSADYAKLLESINGRKDEHIIRTVLLRSLRQAVYAHENIGHFGLAYQAYAHFTSPIRRYPDLVNHRAIRHLIRKLKLQNFTYDSRLMKNLGEHCSTTERRADYATRDVVSWFKCEFMLNKVGKVFHGVISNVTNFGVFVELKDIFVEGLLHISALKNDYYKFDPVRYSLKGKRSGIVYALGDQIKVRLARVGLDEREIDFVLEK